MTDYSHLTDKMTEIQAMLVLAIDEDDPYAEELVGEIKVLKAMMIAAELPRMLWVPHHESLNPYIVNEVLTPQQAADLHEMLASWIEGC